MNAEVAPGLELLGNHKGVVYMYNGCSRYLFWLKPTTQDRYKLDGTRNHRYGKRMRAPKGIQRMQQEIIEKLRAIGYNVMPGKLER